MKKLICILLTLSILLLLAGCGATKTLHCDSCGNEVVVKQSSNMEEDWIIYCAPCNQELFSEHLVSDES